MSLPIEQLVNVLFSQQQLVCGGLVFPFQDMSSC